MYVSPNYRTKKAIKEALKQGHTVTVFQPGPFLTENVPQNGTVYLEGPHYPEPHRWYAVGTVADGKLVAVR